MKVVLEKSVSIEMTEHEAESLWELIVYGQALHGNAATGELKERLSGVLDL